MPKESVCENVLIRDIFVATLALSDYQAGKTFSSNSLWAARRSLA
jgi:hypothetical protein